VNTLTIKEFSGGWNTAQDDTMLPSNMSGDMMDFEVTPLGVLKRRAGVVPIAAPTSATIWAFDWLDTTNGDEYLCCISGTAMIAVTAPSTMAPTTVEAETLITIPGGVSALAAPNSSGGIAMKWIDLDTPTLTIPQSTTFSFTTARHGSVVTGSYSVDSGAWTAITLSATNDCYKTTTISSLADTTHSLRVRFYNCTESKDVHAYGYLDTVTYSRAITTGHKDTTVSASSRTYGFAQLNNQLYYGSNYDSIKGFNGTTSAVTGSGTSAGAFIVEHKRRLFASGEWNTIGIINYTETDDPNNFTGGGSLRFTKDSGGEVAGMAIWNDIIFVGSHKRLWGLDVTDATPSNWTAKLLDEVGCCAGKTMIGMPNGIAFLALDGLRSYGLLPNIGSIDGAGVANLSVNIQPTLDTITRHDLCVAAYFKERIFLSVPLDGSTTNTNILVCDLRRRTENGQPVWYPYDIPNITSLKARYKGAQAGLYAGTSTGQIVKLEVGDSDQFSSTETPAAISAHYVVPPIKADKRGFASTVHFRHVHAALDSDSTQNITLTPTTDDAYPPAITAEVTALTAGRPLRIPVSSRGRYLRLRIDASALAPLSINELTYTFIPPRVR